MADPYAALANTAAKLADWLGLPADEPLTWQVFSENGSALGATADGQPVTGHAAIFAATPKKLGTAAKQFCRGAAFPNLYVTSGLHDPPESRKATTCRRVLWLTLDADACDWLAAKQPGDFADAAAAKAHLHQLDDAELAALLAEHRAALEQQLETLGLPPSAVWRSGYGHYAMFALQDDDGARDVPACKQLNADLMAAVNTAAGYKLVDPAAKDAGTRVVRMPGAYNVKRPDRPRLCRVQTKDGPQWSYADLRAAVPEQERRRPAPAEPYHPPADGTGERLSDVEIAREALARIPNADLPREDWVRVGMALHSVGEELFDDWLAWSRTSAKSGKSGKSTTAEENWRRFDRDKPGGVTVAYLVELAQQRDPAFLQAGWRMKQRPVIRPPGEATGAVNAHSRGLSERTERPRIIATDRFFDQKIDDARAAVEAANRADPDLFMRSGELVEVQADERGWPVIRSVTAEGIRARMARVAEWYTLRKAAGGEWAEVKADPPKDVAASALAEAGRWRVPPLEAVVQVPTLRPDGSLLDRPGYDPATRLLYSPPRNLRLPPIPAEPTRAEATEALARVWAPFAEFPYTDPDADKAAVLALLLTPVLRPAIAGSVPIALIDAPQQGSGKSLIAEAVAVIATGQAAFASAPERSEEPEWRKLLTTLLQDGNAVIGFDNVEGVLRSANFARAVTAPVWSDRSLGFHKQIRVPVRATWIVTGNNIRVGGDLARRCYRVRIDPKQAEPWRRSGFRYPNLRGYIAEHRPELLADLLTMARAWYAAGQPAPHGVGPLGSFEEWRRIIGGILAFVGVNGFLSNLDDLYAEADPDARAWAQFFGAWRDAFGDKPVTVKQLADACEEAARGGQQALPDSDEEARAALAEAVPEFLLTPDGKVNRRSLGKQLDKQSGRRYPPDNIRAEKAGEDPHAKVARWRVATDDPADPQDKPRNQDPPEKRVSGAPAGFAGFSLVNARGSAEPPRARAHGDDSNQTPQTPQANEKPASEADPCCGVSDPNPATDPDFDPFDPDLPMNRAPAVESGP